MNELCNILLVEDDVNDVLLIRRALQQTKLLNPVHVAGDGDQAVEYLMRSGSFGDARRCPRPALMLLDLKLPRKGGLELIAWVRSQDTPLRRLPIVVLTSSKESQDVSTAYELGANSYLVKPVDFNGLLRIVQALELYWGVFNQRPDLE
jgi:CheY-like chemotaxis protein